MTGVTLRYKWITWAMFMGHGLEPIPPSGRLSQKCIHITWIGLPGRWQKHTVRCILLKKKRLCEDGEVILDCNCFDDRGELCLRDTKLFHVHLEDLLFLTGKHTI